MCPRFTSSSPSAQSVGNLTVSSRQTCKEPDCMDVQADWIFAAYAQIHLFARHSLTHSFWILKNNVSKSSLTKLICVWLKLVQDHAGLGGSVGCTSDWWSGGFGFGPHRVGYIHYWRLVMKYFLWSFSPLRWFKKGSCQFLMKECA